MRADPTYVSRGVRVRQSVGELVGGADRILPLTGGPLKVYPVILDDCIFAGGIRFVKEQTAQGSLGDGDGFVVCGCEDTATPSRWISLGGYIPGAATHRQLIRAYNLVLGTLSVGLDW